MRALAVAVTIVWAGVALPRAAHPEGTLRLATDVWLPYENISDTQGPGFSTEVIYGVLDEMGVESTIREMPWARGLRDVFEGRRDALFTAFWTEERATYCHFPEEPLIAERWVYFVRSEDADDLALTSLEQLRGKRIGVLRGASVTREFWDFVRANAVVEEVETDDLNFKKLNKGRLDYVVTSYSNGIGLLEDLDLAGLIEPLPSPVIKEDDLFIMFSKKTVEPQFVRRFSAALKAFKGTETYAEIHEKYFGASAP